MDQASDMCLSRVEPAPFHYEMRATTYGEVFPTNGATTGRDSMLFIHVRFFQPYQGYATVGPGILCACKTFQSKLN